MKEKSSVKKTMIIAAITILAVAIVSANSSSITGFLIPEAARAVNHFDPDPTRQTWISSEPGRLSPESATVDGAIAQLKLSPSGRHVHGFYLDDGTEVNLPPNVHDLHVGEVGQTIEVTGRIHTGLTGVSLMHATSVTNVTTGETMDTSNVTPPDPHAAREKPNRTDKFEKAKEGGAMFEKTTVVIWAAALAVIVGLTGATFLPGSQTPIGLLSSAFADSGGWSGSTSPQPRMETVEGEVSGFKYSPTGDRVDGFFLDGNGVLPGRTAVGMPPHMASFTPPEGASLKVTGMYRTSLDGKDVLHAASITDGETGQTFGIQSPLAGSIAAPPHGGPTDKGAVPAPASAPAPAPPAG